MTIDVAEKDIEIRVTHDLEGDIGRIKVTGEGVWIQDYFFIWKELLG